MWELEWESGLKMQPKIKEEPGEGIVGGTTEGTDM